MSDLVFHGHSRTVQNGWAMPIEHWLDEPNPYAPDYPRWRDIFYESHITSMVWVDGHEYSAPMDAIWPNLEVGLAYNMDLLDEMGLKPPATWAEEVEVGRALKEAGGGLSPWPPATGFDKGGLATWPLGLQILPSMLQAVAPQMDTDGDMFVGAENCLAAFKAGIVGPLTPIYQRAYDEYMNLIQTYPDNFMEVDLERMWREGKIGVIYKGSWEFSQTYNDPNIQFDRGFVLCPLPDSKDIPPLDGRPGAVDPTGTTAGDGSVPADLITAINGIEYTAMQSSIEARKNEAEVIDWWMFLTEPENDAFMVNENQQRIPAAKDAPIGPIFQGIANQSQPLYDYQIAWWGEGLYWDAENFSEWRKIFVEWVIGETDRETHFARQQAEWEKATARYEAELKEQSE
jgi:hypothetical protein